MSQFEIDIFMNKSKLGSLIILKFSILFILLFSNSLFAQQNNLKIKGNVFNSKEEKIENAEIYLYNAKNEIVKTTIAQNGYFEFSNLQPQQYYLQIVNEYSEEKEPVFQLSDDKYFKIILKENTSAIQEVQIKTRKKIFQVQNGNINRFVVKIAFCDNRCKRRRFVDDWERHSTFIY